MAKQTGKSFNDVKAAEDVIKSLNKRFGNDLNARWLGVSKNDPVDVIPTGVASIDEVTGVGGIPRGGLVEIIGDNATGKTALASSIIAEAQSLGVNCFFIDMEQSYDLHRAQQLGVNIDTLGFVQPDDGNQAVEIAREVANSGQFGVIVVDSVATLVPRSELDGESGDANMGTHAKLMSSACRVLSPVVKRNNILFIFINQFREKMVTMGDPRVPTGGKSLFYYAKMRIETTAPEKLTEGSEVVGRRNRIKIVKNKVGPPFRTADYDIYYDDKGIDKIGAFIPVAVKYGIMKKSGTWFSYKGENIAQGNVKTSAYLRDNPEIYEEIKLAIEQARLENKVVVEDKIEPDGSKISIDGQSIDMETGEIIEDTPEVLEPEIIEEPVKRTRKN